MRMIQGSSQYHSKDRRNRRERNPQKIFLADICHYWCYSTGQTCLVFCLLIIQKDLCVAMSKREWEWNIFSCFTEREDNSHNNTQGVFKSVQLKPGLLPIKLMLISLVLMLMHKHIIEERMRGTKAIPALDVADKELSIVQLSDNNTLHWEGIQFLSRSFCWKKELKVEAVHDCI